MSVKHVVDTAQFPHWIKEHEVFHCQDTIDKIFPKIGLHNFKEKCPIVNTTEARKSAHSLVDTIYKSIVYGHSQLMAAYGVLIAEDNSQERNAKCAEMSVLIALWNSFTAYSFAIDVNTSQYKYICLTDDGKIVLKQQVDIFGAKPNPIFKKGENLLKIYGKFAAMYAEVGITLASLEETAAYKDFSRVNVPSTDYTVVFSSSGQEGAWDIGTISMRGITSCQAWTAPQSRGLIGSISSKYVGVIYLQSDTEVPGYGKKMLNRCVVRFVIDKQTNKPIIVMDVMYPATNNDAIAVFKKYLGDKSGIQVHYAGDKGRNIVPTDFYIPEESTNKLLKAGENMYMDTRVNTLKHNDSSIKKAFAQSNSNITDDFKKRISLDISNQIKIKRAAFLRAEEQIKKLIQDFEDKKKEDSSLTNPPAMDSELEAFGGGGSINLFIHFDKRFGDNSIGQIFANAILEAIPNPQGIANPQNYHHSYVMNFMRNRIAIKQAAWKKISSGSWMVSFPKSSEKLFDMIFNQVKRYMLISAKDLIKQ